MSIYHQTPLVWSSLLSSCLSSRVHVVIKTFRLRFTQSNDFSRGSSLSKELPLKRSFTVHMKKNSLTQICQSLWLIIQ